MLKMNVCQFFLFLISRNSIKNRSKALKIVTRREFSIIFAEINRKNKSNVDDCRGFESF